MFHMTNDRKTHFKTFAELASEGAILKQNRAWLNKTEYLPLYEGKMFHHFDPRWGTYTNNTGTANKIKDPAELEKLETIVRFSLAQKLAKQKRL